MAKMIKCKSCGKEISESAKVCPGCGAKNKKPFYKTVWFWAIVVILLIAIAGGGSGENENESGNVQKEQKEIEYLKVDYDELEDARDNNPAAAKDTYKGKYVEVTGRLGVIDSDLKYISLYSLTDEFDFTGIHCTIKNSATRNIVKTLQKDQTITVKGKLTDVGEVLGYYLDITEIIPQD